MHFIRLIRPLNLFIVAATMYGTGWYYEGIYGKDAFFHLFSASYSLLVISTIMIAAAGNIINDYFDVRADRINKPEKVIIGVHVKRRVAIVSHWALNFVAFCIAIYLSYIMKSFWYLFIHLLTINLLWFYSMYLKRKFLSGNIIIAALTGMVPILVGFYFHQVLEFSNGEQPITHYPFDQYLGENYILWLAAGLATFAFILNLAREIVKDMEDVEGDKKLNASTLPITIGYSKTKIIVAFVLLCSVLCSLIVWNVFDHLSALPMMPILACAVLVTVCFILLPFAKEKKDYKRINHLIKLSMVFGLLSPVFWQLMMIYG